MTSSTSHHELISALADGQLRGQALEQALSLFASDDLALSLWTDFHVIGDVLRAPAVVGGLLPLGSSVLFLERFNQNLAASTAAAAVDVAPSRPSAIARGRLATPAANDSDSGWGWKLAAGFATLAAVSAMVWTSSAGQGEVSPSQLAQQSAPTRVLVASPQGLIVQDARLNELLAAHKQLGSGSALQAPSGFLQSAAFEVTSVGDR